VYDVFLLPGGIALTTCSLMTRLLTWRTRYSSPHICIGSAGKVDVSDAVNAEEELFHCFMYHWQLSKQL
jgi:hypothetical protein